MPEVTDLFTRPDALPGWWGKLPGMGDFASRRLDTSNFIDEWDRWLQASFGALRESEVDWVEHYLASPVWLFALGGDVADYPNWIGVVMPSVDAVGRYFPLTLISELNRAPRAAEVQRECLQWWHRATHAALHALEEDMDAAAFELALNSRYATPLDERLIEGVLDSRLVWPLQGECVWLADPWGDHARLDMRCFGLPRGERFAHLFGQPSHAAHGDPEGP